MAGLSLRGVGMGQEDHERRHVCIETKANRNNQGQEPQQNTQIETKQNNSQLLN